jgi:hypothetical protein
MKFIYDEIENELYTEIYLCQYRNFLKRIWIAIKYILGYKCKWGHFDCFVFKNEDVSKLQTLLDKIV